MPNATSDFCHGNGLYVGDNYCWCEGPYTENDCSLTWRQSSYYGLYTTYRSVFIPINSLVFLIYVWRFVIVFHAKRQRALAAASSGSLAGGRYATLFDDQIRSLITGTLGAFFGILLAIDPFGAEDYMWGNYSRELAADTFRIGLAVQNPLWLVRFFIVIQAAFHQPSRIVLNIWDFIIFFWWVITTVNIVLGAMGEWKPSVHIQINAVFSIAVIFIVGLGIYALRILQQLLPKKLPHQKDEDLVWTDQQRKTLRFIRITKFTQVIVFACLLVLALVSSVAALNPTQLVMFKVWLDIIYFCVTMSILLIMGRPPASATTAAATDIPREKHSVGGGGKEGNNTIGSPGGGFGLTSPRPPPVLGPNGVPMSPPGFGNTNGPLSPVSMGTHQPKKSGTFAPGGDGSNHYTTAPGTTGTNTTATATTTTATGSGNNQAATISTPPLPVSPPGIASTPPRSMSTSSHVVHVWGPESEPRLTSSASSPRSTSPRPSPPSNGNIANGGAAAAAGVSSQPRSSLSTSPLHSHRSQSPHHQPKTLSPPLSSATAPPTATATATNGNVVVVDVDNNNGGASSPNSATATAATPVGSHYSSGGNIELTSSAKRYTAD